MGGVDDEFEVDTSKPVPERHVRAVEGIGEKSAAKLLGVGIETVADIATAGHAPLVAAGIRQYRARRVVAQARQMLRDSR